jgi:hypothetical protein
MLETEHAGQAEVAASSTLRDSYIGRFACLNPINFLNVQ